MKTVKEVPGRGGPGHNSSRRIADLKQKAFRKQIAAQKAWLSLARAQIEEDAPWNEVLTSATMTGVKPEVLRARLDASPSTFSRWQAGLHAPSAAFRRRLGADIVDLSVAASERVVALDLDDTDVTKAR